jgi:hypothetical protein
VEMTLSKMVNLASAVLGLLGAAALYKGSFAFERPAAYDEDWDAMCARNRRRLWLQRLGLTLIMASFFLQGAAQFD